MNEGTRLSMFTIHRKSPGLGTNFSLSQADATESDRLVIHGPQQFKRCDLHGGALERKLRLRILPGIAMASHLTHHAIHAPSTLRTCNNGFFLQLAYLIVSFRSAKFNRQISTILANLRMGSSWLV